MSMKILYRKLSYPSANYGPVQKTLNSAIMFRSNILLGIQHPDPSVQIGSGSMYSDQIRTRQS